MAGSLNLHHRHLNESQRAMVAVKLANLEPNHRKFAADKIKQSEAAEKLNVSERTVNAAKKVQQQATPELQQKVEQGQCAAPIDIRRTDLDNARNAFSQKVFLAALYPP